MLSIVLSSSSLLLILALVRSGWPSPHDAQPPWKRYRQLCWVGSIRRRQLTARDAHIGAAAWSDGDGRRWRRWGSGWRRTVWRSRLPAWCTRTRWTWTQPQLHLLSADKIASTSASRSHPWLQMSTLLSMPITITHCIRTVYTRH